MYYNADGVKKIDIFSFFFLLKSLRFVPAVAFAVTDFVAGLKT
jgi:hypothetical protein